MRRPAPPYEPITQQQADSGERATMSRHGLSTVLLALGVILLAGCVSLVGYAKWAEWQHELTQPARLGEGLPERLELPPGAETRIQTEMAVPPPVNASRTADPAAGPPLGILGRAADPLDS